MSDPISHRFRPAEHLRRPSDFQRVYQRRRSASDEWIIVYACENCLPHLRLGMSVSRKVGNAVRRNRIRRLYREAFRLTKHAMPPGLDIIIIPRKTEDPDLEYLKQALPRLVSQLAAKLTKGAKSP